MKKEVSSISHNQGHEVVLQIENALKNAGMDPGEKISDLIKESFFYKSLVEHLKKGGKFVSKLFQKTTTLTISSSPADFIITEESVKNFLQPIIKREAERKNADPSIPDPWTDDDIWKWFENKTIPGIMSQFFATIYRFLVRLNHEQILKEAEKTRIKKVYSYLEALSIILQAILSGEVDEKGKAVVVYFNFKVNDKDILYRFRAYRRDDGQLYLGVSKVVLGVGYDAGDGACFSNI